MKTYLNTGIAMMALIVASCSSDKASDAGSKTDVTPTPYGQITPELWPSQAAPIAVDNALEDKITDLMSQMSLEQKVGQIIQADIGSITPEDVMTYPLGSILNGGNSAPGGDNRAPAANWIALADEFYEASKEGHKDGPFIPMIWGTDAVHGHNNIPGATLFPHNIGLGAANNPELMRKIGEVTAREFSVTGMEWTFAPTIAVVRDDRWGRTYEGYSEDPRIVAAFAGQIVEGIQGNIGDADFIKGEHAIATAKHFVGDGGTDGGKDQGDNLSPEEVLRDQQAAGYPAALSSGVQVVMASFSSWQGEKLHGHKGLLTDVLKDRWNFDGFIVGDWNAHGQIEGCTNEDCPESIIAGLDMFMAPDSWKGLYANTLESVKSGELPMARLDDAVRRILRVKFRAGVMDAPKPSERLLGGDTDVIGSPEHRAVARQAVRESLVLIKNNEQTLPLDPAMTVLVAGDGADNIGKQSGGWTLSWQGTGNTNDNFPGGTSIFDGIEQKFKAAGGKAILSEDGSYSSKPDVAIVVFGENPYAEFQGDVETLDFAEDGPLALLKRYKAAGIPTVSVFLSGRPMWTNPEINASDAFVAAWLPGSEGVGVSDVLVANADQTPAYDFKGRLSYSWPKTALQTPLNVGDDDYDPLFAYGYGLTYAAPKAMDLLSEDAGVQLDAINSENYFGSGKAIAPWRLVAMDDQGEATGVDSVLTSPSGVVEIRSEDVGAQEDSKRFTFSGAGTVKITADKAVNLSRNNNGDMALQMRYRVNSEPSSPVTLTSAGSLDVTKLMTKTDDWQTLDIKLSCFAPGASMNSVDTPFALSTEGAFSVTVSSIRVVSNEGQAICLK